MQSWSDMPNEILNLITVHCGRDCTKVKWMFINKYWFTFYLSQICSTIKISLGNESVTDKILHSPFDVGKHVKHIKLSNIQRPSNLNGIDLSNDILGLIMKRTPNVLDVSLFRSDKDLIYQDWLYFSIILVNSNCWKLQFLPTLGEDNILSAAYYYACAYYSRHTLKKLELAFSMFISQTFCVLKEFTALKTLEVHKKLIGGLEDLESLLQYTPELQQLTVRFASNRICKATKKEYTTYSSIKRLWLYNFIPQNNDELLTLIKEFSTLQSLHIFGEKDKIWLNNVNGPSVINNFFSSINSIPKYQITMSGDKQEIAFSDLWLKFIKDSKKDITLLIIYKESYGQDYSGFENNVAAKFSGGSIESSPSLGYWMLTSQSLQNISDRLRVLYHRNVSNLGINGLEKNLGPLLSTIIAQERIYLKRIRINYSTLEDYTSRANTVSVPQHIKHISFHHCKINFITLKLFLKEFKSLDHVEFDDCEFIEKTNAKSIDMSDTDIKYMKITDFLYGDTHTSTAQTVVVISVYLAMQGFTRYFSIVDDILIGATKRTFELFCGKFNSNEAVVLNIKVGSLQELSLQLTKMSKIQKIPFH